LGPVNCRGFGSGGEYQNGDDRVIVGLRVILSQITGVGIDLVNTGSIEDGVLLELQDDNGGAGENHNIRTTSSLEGQFVLKDDSPVLDRGVFDSEVPQRGSEDLM
jgi:hypothetical protein